MRYFHYNISLICCLHVAAFETGTSTLIVSGISLANRVDGVFNHGTDDRDFYRDYYFDCVWNISHDHKPDSCFYSECDYAGDRGFYPVNS